MIKDEKLVRLWVRSTEPIDFSGDHLSHPVFPILYKNKIISANNLDGLTAFNKRWGYKVWNLAISGGVSSPLLLVSDYLFFTGYDGDAYSVSAADGKVLWKKSIDYPSTQSLLYENGRIYIHTKNSEIIALEASSGEEVWTFSRKNQRKISVGSIGNFVSLGQLLISGLSTGEVVALEKVSGKVRWLRKLNFNSRFRDIKTLVLYDTDKLLVAGYDDHIYNIDVIGGAIKWKRKFSVVTNFITLNPENVCFGTADSLIKCINPSTGVENQSISIQGIAGQITKMNDDNIIYGLSNGGIEILNLKTKKKIRYVTAAGVSNSPFWNPINQEIYFNSNYGNVYVLKLKNEIREVY